jgi:hypothetical protein
MTPLHKKRSFWPAAAAVAASIGTVGILKVSVLLILLPIAIIVLGGFTLEYYEAIGTERRQPQPNGVKRHSA